MATEFEAIGFSTDVLFPEHPSEVRDDDNVPKVYAPLITTCSDVYVWPKLNPLILTRVRQQRMLPATEQDSLA